MGQNVRYDTRIKRLEKTIKDRGKDAPLIVMDATQNEKFICRNVNGDETPAQCVVIVDDIPKAGDILKRNIELKTVAEMMGENEIDSE